MILILPLLGLHYGIIYPFNEFKTGRNLRMSPIYPKLREAGAVFGQVMGYERPTWFDPDYMSGMYLQWIVWYQVGTNLC
jgi:Glycine cleavage system T protein (aminomethyltransferase)